MFSSEEVIDAMACSVGNGIGYSDEFKGTWRFISPKVRFDAVVDADGIVTDAKMGFAVGKHLRDVARVVFGHGCPSSVGRVEE